MARQTTKRVSKRVGSSPFSSKKLGAAIAAMREQRGLNPSQFAKLTGLTRQGIAVLEAGQAEPTISTLEKVANAVGLSVSEVVSLGVRSDEPTNPNALTALSIIRQLDDRSVGLALSVLTAIAKHDRR